jgi:ABC-type amino acid transport substrate-binding protein
MAFVKNAVRTNAEAAVGRLAVAVTSFVLLLAAGCDAFPRDPEGTTERIMAAKTIRVGVIPGDGEDLVRGVTMRIAAALGARLEFVDGGEESLLPRLEGGGLDLVVGRFAEKSPWKDRVAFSDPVRREDPPGDEPILRLAVRKGENRWLMFVARHLVRGS